MGKVLSSKPSGQHYQAFKACEIASLRPFCLIIFGASGDLAKRKLIPAIYHLYIDGLLQENFFVFCTDMIKISTQQYRKVIQEAMKSFLPKDFRQMEWERFSNKLYYSALDFTERKQYLKEIKEKLPGLERKYKTGGDRIFYLAVPPTIFESVIENIGSTGLSNEENGYAHIVVEKPFGRNYESARRLNEILKTYFREDQIFRIDHYVAKETVQNMLMFRFANSIFEPLWNRRYIDHIQITVSESIGIEHRAKYYEKSGIIRDMFQSHIFQLLAVTAMEPPVAFKDDYVRDEKIKVFHSIRPFPLDRIPDNIVTGQYGDGEIDGKHVNGYRKEPGVSPHSKTPTFAAMKVFIDNWRWNGVPFYLRSGKRLAVRKTEISIHYRPVPHMMFSKVMDEDIEPNVLVFRLQPDEGISLTFQTKKPGTKVCLNPVLMDFSYEKEVLLDAYEWVLLDCIISDQMLFLRQEGVEQTWSLLTPVLEKLESSDTVTKFPNYNAGSSGPDKARVLIEQDGRAWRPLIYTIQDEGIHIPRLRGNQH